MGPSLAVLAHKFIFDFGNNYSVTHIHLYQLVFFRANYLVQKNAVSVRLE